MSVERAVCVFQNKNSPQCEPTKMRCGGKERSEKGSEKIATRRFELFSDRRNVKDCAMMNDDDSKTPIVKASNKNYVDDLNFSLRHTRWFLTFLGIWPHVTSNPNKSAIHFSRLIMPVPAITILLILIPMASIPFHRKLKPIQLIPLMSPFTYRVTCLLRNLFLVFRRVDFKECIGHMENDWRFIENDKEREIMMKNVRYGHRLTLICVLCQYTAAFIFNLQPFVIPRKLNALNQTIKPNNVFGSDIYVNMDNNCHYAMVVLFGWFSAICVSTIVVSICNITSVLVCHACGQVQIVMAKLQDLVMVDNEIDPDEVTVKKKIAFIIPFHVRVLRFAAKIDDVLKELFFLEVVSVTIIICFVGYLLATERKNTGTIALFSYTTLLASLSCNIFIHCQIGEILKEQFEAVSKAAYMTEWYRLPGKTGLSLIMLFTIASCPRRLTAGKIVELSIMTFGNIMRTSFGYVNMLLTMADKNS